MDRSGDRASAAAHESASDAPRRSRRPTVSPAKTPEETDLLGSSAAQGRYLTAEIPPRPGGLVLSLISGIDT